MREASYRLLQGIDFQDVEHVADEIMPFWRAEKVVLQSAVCIVYEEACLAVEQLVRREGSRAQVHVGVEIHSALEIDDGNPRNIHLMHSQINKGTAMRPSQAAPHRADCTILIQFLSAPSCK